MKLPSLLPRILSFVLISAIAACGSGGGGKSQPASSSSSSSSSGIVKPQPVTNKITVKVAGLKGAIELVNGADSLPISKDGTWQMKLPVEVGISYNIQLTKQPEQQICTVKNGRKVMVASPLPVEIACSDGFGVGFEITKPKDYSLKSLQVVSNYQRLGGAGDPALTLESKIKTIKNSFIALKNSAGTKTYFLSYIFADNIEAVRLDPQSTVLALLMTEPAITQAIYSRQMEVGSFYNIIAPLDGQKNPQLEGDLKKLADEIARQADKDVDLLGPQSTIAALLERAIVQVLDKISVTPLSPSQANKPVEIYATEASRGSLSLTITNPLDRTIVVSGLQGSGNAGVVYGNNSLVATQAVEPNQIYSLSFNYFGPGKVGSVQVTDADYKRAVIRSSLVDYFLPNLAYYSGGTPSRESVLDCLSNQTWDDFNERALTVYPGLQNFLEQDNYYRAYVALADTYRSYLAASEQMDHLLSCTSIGLSSLSTAESAIAKSHLSNLLLGVNKLREPANVKEDLFRSEKQSHFTAALFQSNTSGRLTVTNAYSVEVTVPNYIDDEAAVEFSGRCLDAGLKPISCTLNWTFEGTPVTGNPVRYTFKTAKDQVVNLVASNANGVQVTKDILVKIVYKGAALGLSRKNTSENLDLSKNLNFDKVFVGSQLPQTLVLTNNGNALLNITNVTVEGAYRTNLTAKTIPIGESLEFDIWFAPAQSQEYRGSLTIVSNDKAQPKATINLFGTGVANVPLGNYEIIENSQTRTEVIAATNETAISGDESFAQVRLFGQTGNIFPQISLKLLNFAGPGVYSLADIDSDNDGLADESCLALYAAARDFTQQYCTGGKDSPAGTMVVTEVSAQIYQVDYDFYATSCLVPTGGAACTPKVIQLRGSARVDKAILQPPVLTE